MSTLLRKSGLRLRSGLGGKVPSLFGLRAEYSGAVPRIAVSFEGFRGLSLSDITAEYSGGTAYCRLFHFKFTLGVPEYLMEYCGVDILSITIVFKNTFSLKIHQSGA